MCAKVIDWLIYSRLKSFVPKGYVDVTKNQPRPLLRLCTTNKGNKEILRPQRRAVRTTRGMSPP